MKQLEIDWETFEAWLFKEYTEITALDRLRYARKHWKCLSTMDLNELLLLTDSQRVHTMKALASLSKFLGVYAQYKQAIKNYGLKWAAKNKDDLIIERLTKSVDPNEIYDWIKSVKEALPKLSNFMDLMAATGIRYNEAIESHNLIVDLAGKDRLSDYYNAERQVLEHYRFKETFIRRGKKLFISFVPERIVQTIGSEGEPLGWNSVKKVVARRVGRLRFGDIREFWASYMTRHLSRPEIDFLQGRVSTSVFMRNYFNPTWIQDLRERVLEAEEKVIGEIDRSGIL